MVIQTSGIRSTVQESCQTATFGFLLGEEFLRSATWKGLGPFVKDQACVLHLPAPPLVWQRHQYYGSDDVYTTSLLVRNLYEVRAAGLTDAANHALARFKDSGVDRVWMHLDADCLADDLMPAVDWRVVGGFTPEEVVALARTLISSGLVSGIDITIYNPGLDTPEYSAGKVLRDVVVSILR
jgi:Arginase family